MTAKMKTEVYKGTLFQEFGDDLIHFKILCNETSSERSFHV